MRTYLLVVASSVLAVAACGGSDTNAASRTPGAAAASAAQPAAPPQPPPPFEYPAPVTGSYNESNVGKFNLVDGLAFTSKVAPVTVVHMTSKAIASPVLSSATCPMTQARAIALIRDASYVELPVDAAGQTKYFGAGTFYEGQGREEEVGGHYWKVSGTKVADGRIAGSVTYPRRGTVQFDLPVWEPVMNEFGANDRMDGNRFDRSRRTPTEAELTKAYTDMRTAALAKDLKTMLELQGFDAKQVEAIRGLPGIDADLAAHANRFLDPGTPEEPSVDGGFGQIGGRGKNSKGEPFFNFYEFTPCGDRLMLTFIGLNPQ